jgi:cobalt-zinc-cadmium resistance protein CzcA
MIRGLVDFALNNRWLMIGAAILLFAWGIVSFHSLPVEAYPDVANNYVQIITQWPGRAAEEVEQQVTVPIEIQMAGIPHLEHLRSTSLAGLSSVMLIFDDDSTDKDNRQEVFQRLGQVTLPAGLQPQMGTDWSPVGQIYWYTLRSTNPAYDSMELKSLEDWKLEKEFKSVPGVVDVSTLGLLPAATSHGIGSDSQRPFAIVIVGGLIGALIISVFLLPTLYVWIARPDDVLPTPETEFEN